MYQFNDLETHAIIPIHPEVALSLSMRRNMKMTHRMLNDLFVLLLE
jgi:hypothetical protein